MADFWGGFGQGFAPAFESARERRIRAKEREEETASRLNCFRLFLRPRRKRWRKVRFL